MTRESDVGRLGGGWIAAAVGLSEYRSPLDAYLRIVGEVEDVREGEAIDRGNFLEPALREWHRAKVEREQPVKGAPVRILVSDTMRHRTHPWASYTPDGVLQRDLPSAPGSHSGVGRDMFLAEYKSPGEDAALKYGEPGTDQVPRDVGVQVHWGLFVTDLPRADVAALIGGELRLFHVARDAEFERELFGRADFFMKEYVAKKRPPPPTFSERDTEWVKSKWPKHDAGKRLQWSLLTPGQRELLARYVDVYRVQSQLTDDLQALENAVKLDVFQDAADITAIEGDESCPFLRVDWKNNAQGNPKWKEIAYVLNEMALRGAAWTPGAFEELVAANRGTAPRVFRPYWRRAKK